MYQFSLIVAFHLHKQVHNIHIITSLYRPLTSVLYSLKTKSMCCSHRVEVWPSSISTEDEDQPIWADVWEDAEGTVQDIFSQILISSSLFSEHYLIFIERKNFLFWTKFQIEVSVSPANIKPRIKLLEYILLSMNFNYLDTVPSVNRLMFKLHKWHQVRW